MKAVFYHKPDSPYKDVRGETHHFPKQYLKRVQNAVGDHFVYYEKFSGKSGQFYTGVGTIKEIIPDEEIIGHYHAKLENYIDFDRQVGYRENGGFEVKLVRSDGSVNGGTAQTVIRTITDEEFTKIVQAGLSTIDEWPDRTDTPEEQAEEAGFGDLAQAHYSIEEYDRPVIEQLTKRKFRDKKFRQNIRRVYDRTCAFTGLRLINGKGRPEIQAAHIVSVECGGNDSTRNGIALSGTVHWMFDRGFLSLSDQYNILVSRHLNEDISHLLNSDLKWGQSSFPLS